MLLITLLLILSWSCSTTAVERLPGNIIPTHYTLSIVTHMSESKYNGAVLIQVICKESTNKILLHVHDVEGTLVITDSNGPISVQGEKNHQNYFQSYDLDPDNELLVIKLSESLKAGAKYNLKISFTGELYTKPEGYYVVKEVNGKKLVATTNFKNTHARTAFPCFDEPAYKAIFTIQLGHRENEQVFSNMPSYSSNEMEVKGYMMTVFKDTPPISTYQVSYTVSEFEVHSFSSTERNTPALTWFNEGALEDAFLPSTIINSHYGILTSDFGLPEITTSVMPRINFIFLPMGEAITPDLGSLGIVLLDQNELLKWKKDAEGKPLLPDVDSFVMYEQLAWQWFGNLVSPDWWYSEWLFRSLSNYVATVQTSEGYASRKIGSALSYWFNEDSKKDSMNVFNPIYESLTTQRREKGMLLIRMIHLTIGETNFKKGLKTFLNKYKHKSAGPDQLWDVLNSQARSIIGALTQTYPIQNHLSKYRKSGLTAKLKPPVTLGNSDTLPKGVSLKQVMETWTDQEGYPVITVKRLDKGKVHVAQRRFLGDFLEKLATSKEESLGCWWIPLTYTTAEKTDFTKSRAQQWLGCEHEKTGLTFNTGASQKDWIIFNKNVAGYYRVQYDEDNWELIIAALNNEAEFTKIDPFNRAQLVNDAMSLAFVGDLQYSTVINLLKYMQHETDLTVWQAFFQNIEDLTYMMELSKGYAEFSEFIRTLLAPVFRKYYPDLLGLANALKNDFEENDSERKLDVFLWSCKFNVQDCVLYSKGIFSTWKAVGVPQPSSIYLKIITDNIICTAVREGTNSDFQYVFKKLVVAKSRDPNHELFLFGVTCTKQEESIKSLLSWTIAQAPDETSIEKKHEVFYTMARGYYTFPSTLNFFYKSFKRIYYFDSKPTVISKYIESLAYRMDSNQLNELKDFVNSNLNIMRNEAVEAVRKGAAAKQKRQIWLASNYQSLFIAITNQQSSPE